MNIRMQRELYNTQILHNYLTKKEKQKEGTKYNQIITVTKVF